MVIFALPCNLAVHTGMVLSRTFSVATSTLFCGKFAIRCSNFINRLGVKVGRLILFSIRTRQHCFHPHIKPCSITRHWLEMRLNVIRNNRHVKITKGIFFDRNVLIVPNIGRLRLNLYVFPMIVTRSEQMPSPLSPATGAANLYPEGHSVNE